MSEKITVWSWRQAIQKSKLASTTKLVLFNLSVYMNEVGEGCFPTIETQAADTGLSTRAVIKHLDLAVKAGFLVKSEMGFRGRKWKRNQYAAIYPDFCELKTKAFYSENQVNEVPQNDNEVVNHVHYVDDDDVNHVHYVKARGSEPDDTHDVNHVHINSPYNSPIISSVQKNENLEKMKMKTDALAMKPRNIFHPKKQENEFIDILGKKIFTGDRGDKINPEWMVFDNFTIWKRDYKALQEVFPAFSEDRLDELLSSHDRWLDAADGRAKANWMSCLLGFLTKMHSGHEQAA